MPKSEPPPQVLRVSRVEDVVATVPYLVGFVPTESLVAVALCGPRERLTFSVRIDLTPPEHDDKLAELIAAQMERAKADAVILCLYTDPPPAPGHLPRTALVETLQRRLPMPVRDALLIHDDRFWSYVCPDPECCPPGGRRLAPDDPGATAIAAAYAMHGHALMPSRDAVVATIAPVTGPAAASMEQAVERVGAALLSLGEEVALASARTLLDELLCRYASPPAQFTHDEAAQLVLALHDIEFRDHALRRCADDLETARPLFTDLVRHAPLPLAAPACAALGFIAYVLGDGVVASTALERALDCEPGYSMAELLLIALRGQVPPREIRAVWTRAQPQARRSVRRR
jgi:hypothetical protein